MSDSVNQPRTFEVLTAAPVRALRNPRDWPNEEKERLTAETLLPGANVSAIARAEGLDPSQLYGWRRKALSSGLVAPLAEAAAKEVKFAKHVCRRGCERSGWLRLPCSSPDEGRPVPGRSLCRPSLSSCLVRSTFDSVPSAGSAPSRSRTFGDACSRRQSFLVPP